MHVPLPVKVVGGLATTGLVAGTIAFAMAGPAVAGGNHDNDAKIHKSYVCKYVGTPGVDERLQTGQNPIWVDNHSLEGSPEWTQVGQKFKDAQGRSIVIVANTAKLTPEPGVDQCPAPEGPPPTSTTTGTPTGTPTDTGTPTGTTTTTATVENPFSDASASAECYPSDGNVVKLGGTFVNLEGKKVHVVASSPEGTTNFDVAGNDNTDWVIPTTKHQVDAGKVTFTVTWADGSPGTDTYDKSYGAQTCAASSTTTGTPTGTPTDTGTPTGTTSSTTSSTTQPTTTATETVTSTKTSTATKTVKVNVPAPVTTSSSNPPSRPSIAETDQPDMAVASVRTEPVKSTSWSITMWAAAIIVLLGLIAAGSKLVLARARGYKARY
jgi:hypothetical protein